MDAHRVDVFNGAHDDGVVRAIADHLHLEFLPAEDRFLDQHRGHRRGIEPAAHDRLELLAVVGNAAALAAEREGGADDRRQPDMVECGARLIQALGEPALRAFEPDLLHRIAKQQAVFRDGDGIARGADQLDAVAIERARIRERHGGVQRGLAAHGGQERIRLFARDDALDDLGRDRLDIGRVGEFRVGHDRRRVGIHQHDPVALGPQSLARLRARIVELTGLADHNRPGTDHEDR